MRVVRAAMERVAVRAAAQKLHMSDVQGGKMRYKRKIYSGVVLEQEVYSARECDATAADIEKKLCPPETPEERRAANERHSRKRMIRNMNASFAAGGLYVTLTYDDSKLPATYGEAKRLFDNYIRRLQRKFPRIKMMGVTGRGRRSGRLHHHMVISGAFEKDIINKWGMGAVTRIEPLRAHNIYNGRDHGRDYTALAIYMFGHADEAVGEQRRRWKQTKNITQPEAEKPKEAKRNYTAQRPPMTPKGYELVEVTEGAAGYLCFKYVRAVTGDTRVSG